jgi:agmatine deiminase
MANSPSENNESIGAILGNSDFPFLPAIETDSEKLAESQGRGQGYYYRFTHKELYSVTEAPPKPVVRKGEFEPMQYLYVAYVGAVPDFVADMVAGAYKGIQVRVVTFDESYQKTFETYLTARSVDLSKIQWVYQQLDSVWMRDYGPMAITAGGELSIVDMRYYPARVHDDAFPTEMANDNNIKVYRPDIYAEGGDFFSNGEGICFTTKYMTTTENPGVDVSQIFKDYYGCTETHYLQEMAGNVIYHIDMFFYVAAYDTILLGQYTKEQSPANYKILEDTYAYLSKLTTKSGKPFKIIRVPMPNVTLPDAKHAGVVRTYLNLVAVNDVVLVPIYEQEPTYEKPALDMIQTAFPDRTLVPVYADSIARQYGSVHCTTQTIPAN